MSLRNPACHRLPAFVAGAVATLAVLALPAAAPAATSTYEGGITDVSGPTVRLDIASKRVEGKLVRTVTSVRTTDLPAYCDGGQDLDLDVDFRPRVRVARDGRFSATVYRTRDDFDSVSFIRGEVRGPNASGQIGFSGENPIFDSCSTGVLRFYADRVQR